MGIRVILKWDDRLHFVSIECRHGWSMTDFGFHMHIHNLSSIRLNSHALVNLRPRVCHVYIQILQCEDFRTFLSQHPPQESQFQVKVSERFGFLPAESPIPSFPRPMECRE